MTNIIGDMPAIRVVLDNQIFATQKYGGVSRYFSSILPLLREYGCKTKIIAPFYVNSYLRQLPKGLVVGKQMAEFRGAWRCTTAVNRIFARPLAASYGAHVVHETYYASKSHTPRNVPIVLTVHDMIHELFPRLMTDKDMLYRKASAIRRADRILCVSESTKQDLLLFFPEVESRVSVTLLGFDEKFSDCARPKQKAIKPYLLHVGSRSGYKNFAALLDAFAQSQSLRADFDLVCIGGGKWTTDETNAILRHRLEQSVRRYDASDEELKSWYAGAEVFVYPSIYEGFGIPPLEAMAANCPVVAVRASSVPEVCGPAAELAEIGSSAALRAAIETVVYSTTRANALRAEGQTRLGQFSWHRTAAETAAVYRQLA